jgi:hypothetical protein
VGLLVFFQFDLDKFLDLFYLSLRMHIIEQFNGGVYDTIIASDEKFLDEDQETGKTKSNNNDDATDDSSQKAKNQPKAHK